MGKSIIETFDRARSFLAARGFARNLRLADVAAVRQYSSSVAPNIYWHSYRDAGGVPGPLDAEGNMPTSSAAFILATMAWFGSDPTKPDVAAADLAALALAGGHIVRVAGTDVLTVQLGRELVVPGQEFMYDSNGIYGVAEGTRIPIEPTPPLYIGPGERVQQAVLVADAVALQETPAVRLGLTLLVADQGTD